MSDPDKQWWRDAPKYLEPKQTKQWTQRDGTKIRICDMEDRHLLNTIRMLERQAEAQQLDTSYPCFNGEMAQMYAEAEWNEMMTVGPEYFFPIYEDLCADARRRGIWSRDK